MTLYRIKWKGRPWGQIEAISAPDAVTRFWDSYPADMRETLTAQGIRKDDFTASPKGTR